MTKKQPTATNTQHNANKIKLKYQNIILRQIIALHQKWSVPRAAKKDVVETVKNADCMTLLISKVEKLQLVAPAGRRGVVAIAQSVHYMIPAKPKSIKPEGKKILDGGIVLQGQNWNPCWWMMMIVGSISPCRLKNYRSFDHHSKNTSRTDSRNTL